MIQNVKGLEEFERREDFEEPDPGYEQDDLLMCDKKYSFEEDEEPPPEKVETGESEVKKNTNTGKEEEMGLLGKKKRDDDLCEAAEEEIRQMEAEYAGGEDYDDEEEEQPAPKPVRKKAGKKAAPVKKKGSGVKFMLLGIVLLLLVGGGYFAWEMFMAPAPMPQQAYRPPVKPKIHPQERKVSAKPVPSNAVVQQNAVPQSAAELAMLETKRPSAVAIVEGNAAPVPDQRQTRNNAQPPVPPAQPAPVINNDEVNKGLKGIGKQLDDIKKSLDDLRGMVNGSVLAGTSKGGDVSREALKEMTAEIQALSAKNKSLRAEITKAEKKIEELRGVIAKNKGGKPDGKKPDSKKESRKESVKAGGDASGWEILGFSGNRVVIADERGTHSINVGQSYNGVKIISVDVEGGSVKTSAGVLKYGQ